MHRKGFGDGRFQSGPSTENDLWYRTSARIYAMSDDAVIDKPKILRDFVCQTKNARIEVTIPGR